MYTFYKLTFIELYNFILYLEHNLLVDDYQWCTNHLKWKVLKKNFVLEKGTFTTIFVKYICILYIHNVQMSRQCGYDSHVEIIMSIQINRDKNWF